MLNELRCAKCNKKLGERLSGRVEIVCPRCGHFNVFDELGLTTIKSHGILIVGEQIAP